MVIIMGKLANINLNQGIDSMVRILNYLRRREINIVSVDMKKTDEKNVDAKIIFDDSVSEEKILSHLNKICDIKSVEIV